MWIWYVHLCVWNYVMMIFFYVQLCLWNFCDVYVLVHEWFQCYLSMIDVYDDLMILNDDDDEWCLVLLYVLCMKMFLIVM